MVVAVSFELGLVVNNAMWMRAEKNADSAYSLGYERGWVNGKTEVEAAGKVVKTGIVKFKVTAYCPCEICCGEFADGVTASGMKARKGLIAAGKEYDFGQIIYVPGYSDAVVADRGSRIGSGQLDVFFETHDEALEWGVRVIDCAVR